MLGGNNMKKFKFSNEYLMKQSKKCLEKSKKYLNNDNKDINLAIFYNNASIGYKMKAEKSKVL